jgi:hypothetical protein
MLEKLSIDSKGASEVEWYTAGMCEGFFSGFNDGEFFQYLVALPAESKSKSGDLINAEFLASRPWCEPKEGITLQQRYMMFNKFVRNNPDSLHKDAYLTLLLAMKPYFPCR